MPQCMEKYKNKFAIEFAKVMQQNSAEWKASQDTHIKNLYTIWVFRYIFACLVGFAPIKKESYDYDVYFHICTAIVLFIGSIFYAIYFENSQYQEEMKEKLFQKLVKIFGKDIVFGLGEISSYEYNNSMLFNKKVTFISTDDRFSGVYNETPFVISEDSVTHNKRYKGGKSEEYMLFKGVAMHFKMKKQIKSRVLIYSKNMFNKVPQGYEKVEFEYEKFNKKYNVYVQKSQNVNGQIEARYLFNTAFMDRFMQLQTSFRVSKMQCSIYEDSMLILLSTNKDLFEINPLFKKVDDINQYNYLFDEFASVLSFIDVLNLASKTGL